MTWFRKSPKPAWTIDILADPGSVTVVLMHAHRASAVRSVNTAADDFEDQLAAAISEAEGKAAMLNAVAQP